MTRTSLVRRSWSLVRPWSLIVTDSWSFVFGVAAGLAVASVTIGAHSGPPYPIVSNRSVGAYKVSVWTDPDATDDGSAAGQFWVMVEPERADTALFSETRADVAIRPLDRPGQERRAPANPVNHDVSRQFVALVMDHEGRYGVSVTIDGPLGPAGLAAEVDATYDLRPSRALTVVYLVPFLLVGFLWLKLLLRRRHAR